MTAQYQLPGGDTTVRVTHSGDGAYFEMQRGGETVSFVYESGDRATQLITGLEALGPGSAK